MTEERLQDCMQQMSTRLGVPCYMEYIGREGFLYVDNVLYTKILWVDIDAFLRYVPMGMDLQARVINRIAERLEG